MRLLKTTLSFLLLALFLPRAGALGSKSPILAIEIEGNVPLVLQVSVNESKDATLQLSGLTGSTEGRQSGNSNHSFFAIHSDLRIIIGSLKIFSNHLGNYCISISSQNGSMLRRDNGAAGTGVRYDLLLNGQVLHTESGLFEYEMSGKSDSGGSSLWLSLLIGSLPEGLQDGRYSDRLSFTLTVK